ncbi:hypothetical protein [Burkholderia gladioli]|uniref:hypothetical protein n=1 Tax=Burkholderia gladioli TaxID=28095 RepID=UPI000AE7469D|nr:hypothetical protein [Burkholderia gladioli]NBI46876.1 hypothetical protein [Burkholderia sp. ISTR5]
MLVINKSGKPIGNWTNHRVNSRPVRIAPIMFGKERPSFTVSLRISAEILVGRSGKKQDVVMRTYA